MSDVRIVAVGNDSCAGDCYGDQMSWPIDRSVGGIPIAMRCREWVKSSIFRGRLEGFGSSRVVVVTSDVALLASPCPLRMAVKSMYEHNTF